MKRQLFTLFFIAAALVGSAQTLDTSKQRQPILANPGYSYVSIEALRALVPPRDTIKLALRDSGSLAYKNGRFWQWSGTYWDTLRAAVGGAGGGGADGNNYPTSLSYSGNTLTLGRNGLANLTTTINVPAQFNPTASGGLSITGTYPNMTFSAPAQFNPIAGTNVTLSGTYPNITINATGGGGGSADSTSKPGYASKYYVDSVFNSGDTVVTNNEGATGVTLARSSNDTLHFAKLVAGTNVTVTKNGDNSVTIASTASGGIDTATASLYYFKDGGNNFSAAANIGTNTAQDLRFKVGNAEVMRLNQSNGQLLVGTTTPLGGYKMVVGGHFQVNSGFDIWAAGGIRLTGSLFGTSTTGNTFYNTAATSHASRNIYWAFTNAQPTASSGVRQQILGYFHKNINRGTSGFDSTETVLKVDAIVTGSATDVRGIWQGYGTNLFNTSFGSTYIGYDSTAKTNTYKFNVNGTVQINKDSLPAVSSPGTGEKIVIIDNTTGQLKKTDWGGLISGGATNTIPRYGSTTTLVASALTDDGTTVSSSRQMLVSANFRTTGSVAYTGTQTITSGTATTLNQTIARVIVNPGSVLANHTITMPASPEDGQIIDIYFGGSIGGGAAVVTTLTISANTGQTLMQPTTPSTAVGGDHLSYMWYGSNSTWYRRK